MKGTFAYSLDRETFTGVFNTRDEAVRAGCLAAERLHTSLTEVYVGQRVGGDPQADLHAWEVIKSMRDRARSAAGDEAASYLGHVSAEQARDLDGALESTILRWLAGHKIGPSFYRFEAVSEHPINCASYQGFGKVNGGHGSRNGEAEVHDIGDAEYAPTSR